MKVCQNGIGFDLKDYKPENAVDFGENRNLLPQRSSERQTDKLLNDKPENTELGRMIMVRAMVILFLSAVASRSMTEAVPGPLPAMKSPPSTPEMRNRRIAEEEVTVRDGNTWASKFVFRIVKYKVYAD